MRSFCPTIRGAEALLVEELTSMGATDVKKSGGVALPPLRVAYHACLWSRLASRILQNRWPFPAATPEALYGGIRHIHWPEHIPHKGTFAIDFTTVRSAITHPHFGALKTKDAIADQFTSIKGSRPDVAILRPDVRVHVHVFEDQATAYIDLSGESLHRRGYRSDRGAMAPLKEALADTILVLSGWQKMLDGDPRDAPSDVDQSTTTQPASLTAKDAGTLAFLDPLCGSGTLPIEAALIALKVPPGFKRTYFGFTGWLGHDAILWDEIRKAAGLSTQSPVTTHQPRTKPSMTADAETSLLNRLKNAGNLLPDGRRLLIRGSDSDPEAVKTANENARLAGVQEIVKFECKPLERVTPPSMATRGSFVCNPPYGKRLSPDEGANLHELYPEIGDILKSRFKGWDAAVFSGNREVAKHIGLKPSAKIPLFNGAIECRLFRFQVY